MTDLNDATYNFVSGNVKWDMSYGYLRVFECVDEYPIFGCRSIAVHEQMNAELARQDLDDILEGRVDPALVGIFYFPAAEDLPAHAIHIKPPVVANAYFAATGVALKYIISFNRLVSMELDGFGRHLLDMGCPLVFSAETKRDSIWYAGVDGATTPFDYEFENRRRRFQGSLNVIYKGRVRDEVAKVYALNHLSEEVLAATAPLFEKLNSIWARYNNADSSKACSHIKTGRADVLSEMCCGMYSQNELRWVKNYRNDSRKMLPYRVLSDFLSVSVIEQFSEYARYRKMADDVIRIANLWNDEMFREMWYAFSNRLITPFEHIDDIKGEENEITFMMWQLAYHHSLDKYIAAYKKGVPFEDILA